MRGQKGCQVFRDGRIGGVGEAELLETGLPGRGFLVQIHVGQEAVDQQLSHLFAIDFHLQTATDQTRARSRQIHRQTLGSVVTEQFFFHALATAHQHVPLMGSESPSLGKLLLQVPRQGQIQVVAAQDQVISDGDAVELNAVLIATAAGCLGVAPAGAGADANQREIGCAATDIADQNRLSRLHPRLPVIAVFVDPGIEGRLRFFQQHDPRQLRPVRPPARSIHERSHRTKRGASE